MNNYITFVGIDVHKKQHKVCILFPDQEKAQEFTMNNTESDIKRFIKRLKKQVPGDVRLCYEAGPCGFDLQRKFAAAGLDCDVIAPSCTPEKKGERIKTDRRDAKKLATYLKAGLLTSIQPPTEEEEAVRDVCRCRNTAKENQKRAQQHLLKFLLRQGIYYQDGSHWTQKHFQWLRGLSWSNSKLRFTFDCYLAEVEHCLEQVKIRDKEIEQIAEEEPYRTLVGWLRCFRGIDLVTAMNLVAELYGFSRFNSAPEFMAFLGLVPSEESSGERRRPGSITKTGNRRIRRLLIEAGWHQRSRIYICRALRQRRQGQPEWVIHFADQAMRRLHQRFHRLEQKGKNLSVVVTAIARELAGFIWGLLHQGEQATRSGSPLHPLRPLKGERILIQKA